MICISKIKQTTFSKRHFKECRYGLKKFFISCRFFLLISVTLYACLVRISHSNVCFNMSPFRLQQLKLLITGLHSYIQQL